MRKIKTLLSSLLFKWLKRQGVKARLKALEEAKEKADRVHGVTGQKVMVFYSGQTFHVLTKENIRNAKRAGLFKGMDYAGIEKKAVYVR